MCTRKLRVPACAPHPYRLWKGWWWGVRRAGNGEKPSVPTQGSVALLPQPAGGRKLSLEAPQPSALPHGPTVSDLWFSRGPACPSCSDLPN